MEVHIISILKGVWTLSCLEWVLAMFNGLRHTYHAQIYNIASLSSMTSEQCTKRQSGPLSSVQRDNIYGSLYPYYIITLTDLNMFGMMIWSFAIIYERSIMNNYVISHLYLQ